MSTPLADSPSGYATHSSSKRTSSSPQSMENAKRLALALAQTPGTDVPIITQPEDDMDWERVPVAPAKQPPTPAKTRPPPPAPSPSIGTTEVNEANDNDAETRYTDYPTDDRKPAASTPMIDSAANQLMYDDEEDDDDDEEDDDAPGQAEYTAYAIPRTTKPNSLCRHIVNAVGPCCSNMAA
jgi:hypothetical protein